METDEQRIIENLELKPHPEGGYYRETYRSGLAVAEKNLPDNFGGRRSLATSILFFLPKGEFSAFHRLRQDEVWYYHIGDRPELHCIYPDRSYEKIMLGNGVHDEDHPQVVIPAGTYFAANAANHCALFGCLATPGFDFADLDMPGTTQLTKKFPEYESLIRQFTRS